MRISNILRGPTASPASLPWLTPLKSAELQRVARATGIQSSGTKAALLQRIQSTIQHGAVFQQTGPEKNSSDDWSILSIDMGIQNLAFAHLRAPNPVLKYQKPGSQAQELPKLTDWRRLAVSEISSLDLASETEPASANSLFTALSYLQGQKAKDAFSPDVYAANAYTLITALLSTYKPTHVLIERQRFRSGGGSAVQEWTLRVGVFEGMLYAILHALRQERGGYLSSLQVHGVEPKRVVRYWSEIDGAETAEAGASGKKKGSAREVKKAKIDLVGKWLAHSLISRENIGSVSNSAVITSKSESEVIREVSGLDGSETISINPGAPAEQLAVAYVQKWQKQNAKKKRSSEEAKASEIGKLDDLADCLLQGVTWYEWQVMRERLFREGFEALE